MSDITVRCVRHGGDAFGCTVQVDGRITAFLDGHFDGTRSLAEIEADVLAHQRRLRAAPVITRPEYARMLRDRRIDQEVSLRDMAARLKMDAAQFSEMERGVIPPPNYRLARVWAMSLGMTPEESSALFALDGGAG